MLFRSFEVSAEARVATGREIGEINRAAKRAMKMNEVSEADALKANKSELREYSRRLFLRLAATLHPNMREFSLRSNWSCKGGSL